MENFNGSNERPLSEPHEPDAKIYRGAVPLDLERYREYLKELNLSDEAKDEMLLTLWRMMQQFVDIGWGDNFVQRTVAPGEVGSGGNQVEQGDKK
jgi:hypothetical protein